MKKMRGGGRALPEKVGREGIQAHMKEMALGGKSSISKKEQDRSCKQGAEFGCGKAAVPIHWLQFSLGSRSRGHVLGVGGRPQRLSENTEKVTTECGRTSWKK